MYLSVKNVVPQTDYTLLLTFENDERRRFDMKPYLDTGVFRELRDVDMFNTARVSFDTVEWRNEVDIDPEFLYRNSVVM
jgi:hypothetical protein